MAISVALFQHASYDPFAGFAEDTDNVRFYLLFNLLDPKSRLLLERSTAQRKFQMVVAREEGGEQVSFGLRQPFQYALERTAGRVARPFEHWLKTVIEMAPELPKLFANQFTAKPTASTSHCAVVMLSPARLEELDAFLSAM